MFIDFKIIYKNPITYLLLIVFIGISCAKMKEKSSLIKAELEYKIPAELGEGAFWNYKTQEFYWIDIEGQKLHIYNPKTKINKSLNTASRIGTGVPIDKNKAVVALQEGIYVMNTNSGETTLLSDIESDIITNRFNDGKCDPLGNLWVGSMSLNGEKEKASLYKIEGNGKTSKMLDSITTSNGIVWTKDKKMMYYIDTPTRKIMSYDFNVINASISNGRVAVEIPESLGFPDGMAIDENDMLWVGMWKGGTVINFNPKTGKVISKIELPALNVTSCAFGGQDLDELYITTARRGMTDEELKRYPLSGSIFKVKPGVKGVKSSFFKSKSY